MLQNDTRTLQCQVSKELPASVFKTGDTVIRFIRNIGQSLPDYMTYLNTSLVVLQVTFTP
jgi:hypothetical protein